MSKTMEKACKGSPEAMQELYIRHRKSAVYLARLLVQDENAAGTLVCKTFRGLWDDLLAWKLEGEEDFRKSLIWKTAVQCRAYLAKQDAKSVRIPANRAFALLPNPERMDVSGDAAEMLIKNLPVFQRFVYVLQGMYAYGNEQLAQLMHTNAATIQMALDAKQLNYERILAAASQQLDTAIVLTAEEIDHRLSLKAEFTDIPGAVNKTVRMGIDSVCQPILQKKKDRQARVLQIAVVAMICCAMAASIVLAVIYWPEGNTDATAGTVTTAPATTTPTTAPNTTGTTSPTEAPLPDTNYTPEALDESVVYYADILVENYGTITVQLYQTEAPITAANFVKLAREGFYDGLSFHRILEGYMMQGGDPEGTGYGSAENTIVGEFSANGYDNGLSHTAGAISMARSEDYNSASCQFFIVHEDNTGWDGQYAVFGYVIEGMEIVDAICTAAEPTDSEGSIAAENQPVIISVTIREEAAATQ